MSLGHHPQRFSPLHGDANRVPVVAHDRVDAAVYAGAVRYADSRPAGGPDPDALARVIAALRIVAALSRMPETGRGQRLH
jgi:hypothetical protein